MVDVVVGLTGLGNSVLAINPAKRYLLPGHRIAPAVKSVSFTIGQVTRQISVRNVLAFSP